MTSYFLDHPPKLLKLRATKNPPGRAGLLFLNRRSGQSLIGVEVMLAPDFLDFFSLLDLSADLEID